MFETTLTVESKTLALADKALATVRIVGPTPLKVVLPKSILDETTSLNWTITPLGPATESRDGVSFVWQQQFKLSPFIVGDSLSVQFNDFRVNDTAVTLPTGKLSVSTSVQSLTNADVRPVTPLEMTPGTTSTNDSLLLLFGVLVVLGLLLSVAGTWLWLRRKTEHVVTSPMDSLRHDLNNWVVTADKTFAMELARRIRTVFAEPVNNEQAEHFSRFDRWLYSSDVPSLAEVQVELEYWRGVLDRAGIDSSMNQSAEGI